MPDPIDAPDAPDAIDIGAVRRAVCAPRGSWSWVEVVARTGSTNADLLAAAGSGPAALADRSVLVAEHQDAGRGRRDRVWEARRSEGLTVSVLLRPAEVPVSRWGWAPLLTGLALVEALDTLGADPADVALKWPNDLLLGPRRLKGAGVLAEVGDGGDGTSALVVGIGLNVTTPVADLPAGATSLAADGVTAGRGEVLIGLLEALARVDAAWRASGGDVVASGLATAYRARCATLGQDVAVTLPGGRELRGRAVAVDDDGRLRVRADGAGGSLGGPGDPRSAGGFGSLGDDTTAVSAGDVVHVRPAGR